MQKKIDHSLSLIEKYIDKYYDKIAVASSFGKDSVCLVHLCKRIRPDIQIFSIMTPYKFKETLDYKDKITKLWNLNLKTYQAKELNFLAYEINTERCCLYYKVAQVKKAIADLDLKAWFSGLRKNEGHTRKFTEEIQYTSGLVKVNPIFNWTEDEIWEYHKINDIPIHPLYKKGYRSLGCEPCSAPNTETERGGRWQGTDKCGGECGIHTKSLK